ncbi:unnamed protein product [Sympodiomycopsis kandeliae]
MSSLGTLIRKGLEAGGARSVCVLDTNALLNAPELLSAVFEILLKQARQAYQYNTVPGAPFTILIPRCVLNELDGLKSGNSSSNRAIKARKAARWILDSLTLAQKSNNDQVLPFELIPLIVEKSEETQDVYRGSVDEELVHLCKNLSQETSLPVLFCSNDVIARSSAESSRIRTFDLETILKLACKFQSQGPSPHSPDYDAHQAEEKAMIRAAQVLVEQWSEQVLTSTQERDDEEMMLDQDHNDADSALKTDLNPHIDFNTLTTSPPRNNGRNRSQSSSSSASSSSSYYMSYYQRKQLQLQRQQQQEQRMEMDIEMDVDHTATQSRRKSASSSVPTGRATSDSVWARK